MTSKPLCFQCNLLLLLGLLFCQIGSAHLGVQSVRGIFVEKLAGNVRPEFVEERPESTFGSNQHAIGERLTDPGVACRRVVEVRDGPTRDVAANVGDIRFPAAGIVMLAHYIGHQRVEHTMGRTSVAQAKIARILMKQSGQNAIAEQISGEGIEICRSCAFPISLRAPFKSGVAGQ